MGSKGGGSGSTNTVTQNSAPPPQVMAAYQQATGAAQQAAGAPYQPYTGSMVAPFSTLQTSAFGNAYAPVNAFAPAAAAASGIYGNAAGAYGNTGTALTNAQNTLASAMPQYGSADTAYAQAANAYGASTAPLWGNTMQYSGDNVNQYFSPYLNDVVNSTAQQFANTNAIQNAGIVGNAAAQGAWGGDRSAVAQAITAGQQQQAEAPVLAGLYNTGFTTAQGEFNTQQAAQLGANEAQGWLGSQAGAGLSGIAAGEAGVGNDITNVGAQQANLAGIYNQMGAGLTNLGAGVQSIGTTGAGIASTEEQLLSSLGAQQQGEAQAGLNVPYQQYVAEQAYPYQAAQYFANVAEGTGSLSGGQSSTTSPGPSTASQLLGLGIGGAGLLGETGAFGSSGWLGGLIGGGAGTSAAELGAGTALAGGSLGGAGFASGIGDLAAGALVARGGAINPTKGAMPRPPQVGARPMDIGLRFIPHKLHMADGGGIIGYRPSEIQHFDTGGSPVSPTMPSVSIPDVSISWIPQSQGATGHGPPNAPQAAQQQPTIGSQLSAMGSALKTSGLGTSLKSAFSPSSDSSSAGIVGGDDYAGGGGIRGYDSGGWTGFTADDIQPSWFGPGQPEQATSGSHQLGTRDKGKLYNLPGTTDLGSGAPTDQMWMHYAKPDSQDLASGGGIRGYDEGGDIRDLQPAANTVSAAGPAGAFDTSNLPGAVPNPATAGNGIAPPASVELPDVKVTTNAPSAGWQRAMPIIERDESDNKNIMQKVYGGKPGEINPSTGTHTAPSTAQGYLQITNSTWRENAPDAGVDLSQYPTAMSAPREVQEKVGEALYNKAGLSPWAPYNPRLAADLGWNGQSARGTQLAQADTGTMSDASPAPMGIVGSAPSPARSQALIENATSPASMNALHSMGVDPWLALMTAGFGMAAGNSPHALQNIGAGALAGAQSLQQQRLAGPKMALESAEAQKAQAEATLTGAKVNLFMGTSNDPYAGGANPSPQDVAGALDAHISGTAKDLSKNAEAVASAPNTAQPVTSPAAGAPAMPQSSPAQPAPISAPPVATAAGAPAPAQPIIPPEVQQLHQQFQSQIATIDQQIAQVQRTLSTYQTPQMQRLALIDGTVAGSRNALLGQLSSLQERRLGYVTADPYASVVTEAAKTAAQNPALIARAAGETTARTGAEPTEYQTSGAQGSTVTRVAPRGQVMAGNAPGMQPTASSQTPATEDGKYDPDPASLVPTQPPAGQGVTKVNLTKAQEDKLANDAGELKEYRETASNAPTTVLRSQQLADIIHRLQTGAGTETATELANWARTAGLGYLIPERFNPTDAQELNKLTTNLVFEQLKAIGGRPMVTEIQGLQKSNPNLALTNEANLAILANIQGEAKYVKDRYLNASAVFSQHGQLGNFDQKYLQNSPIGDIYSDTKKIIEGGHGAPPVPGAILDKGQWKVKIGDKWYAQPGAP